MTKKQATTTELVPANIRNSDISTFSFTDQEQLLAQRLGIDIGASLEMRLSAAVGRTNQALRLVVEAGLLFISAKAELKHGEFMPKLEELGVNPKRAHECMVFARAAAALPDDLREALMHQPKSKALALASADIEVLEDLLADDAAGDLNALSVRELRQRIRDLEAAQADTAVERDTAIAERDGLAKKLRKRERDAEDHDGTPIVIADMRAEGAALVKKAELALSSLHPLGVDMLNLLGNEAADGYVNPSLRLVLSGIVALRVQTDGLIKQYAEALGDETHELATAPLGLEFLSPEEITTVAQDWSRLVAVHQHEAALRAHEREQARPKGKGRPKNAPEALEA
jgi:hypothetical protein